MKVEQCIDPKKNKVAECFYGVVIAIILLFPYGLACLSLLSKLEFADIRIMYVFLFIILAGMVAVIWIRH